MSDIINAFRTHLFCSILGVAQLIIQELEFLKYSAWKCLEHVKLILAFEYLRTSACIQYFAVLYPFFRFSTTMQWWKPMKRAAELLRNI